MKQKRNFFDLSHYIFQCGLIGSLQTLKVIPVIAGDLIKVQMEALIRLTEMRRTLVVDAIVDWFAFFVPHRHVYGDDWVTMLSEGLSGSSTLPKVNLPSNGTYYLGQTMNPSADDYAEFLNTGYNQIWDRYFRFLKLTPTVPDDYDSSGYPTGHSSSNSPISGSLNMKQFGFMTTRLKMPWTCGIEGTIVASDRDVVVGGSGTTMNLTDFEQTKAKYHNIVDLEYLGERYNDLLKHTFGSKGVNIDADERPQLLMRKTVSLSGHDVDGTDDAALGDVAGKGVGMYHFGFPRRLFPEHGCIWLMCCVRFPTIGTREIMALSTGDQNYEALSGDYKIALTKSPEDQVLDKWMSAPAAGTSIGRVPHGEEWRHCHNVVHYLYESLTGFPFLKPQRFSTHKEAVYHADDDYDSVFKSNSLGHWQFNATCRVDAWRHFPTAADSIWATV